jgi:hypothetical protein
MYIPTEIRDGLHMKEGDRMTFMRIPMQLEAQCEGPEFRPRPPAIATRDGGAWPAVRRASAYGLLGVPGAPAAGTPCRFRKLLTSRVLLPNTSL